MAQPVQLHPTLNPLEKEMATPRWPNSSLGEQPIFALLFLAAREQPQQPAPSPQMAYAPSQSSGAPPTAYTPAPPPISTGPTPAAAPASAKFCPSSGQALAADQKFCLACGRPQP